MTDLLPADDISEQELLSLALALEKKSEHPLAGAVLKYAAERQLTAPEVSDFHALPGNGLCAVLNNETLLGGSMMFVSSQVTVPAALLQKSEKLAMEGKTPLIFARNQKLVGIIAVADVIKEDSPQAIRELQNMGIRVVMLTGDNERTARAIGKQAGVDDVIAGVLPDGKESVIRSLKEQGRVAMVGDGINDTPALAAANVSVAMNDASVIARETADITIKGSDLRALVRVRKLSIDLMKRINKNFRFIIAFNSALLLSGFMGVIQPSVSAFLHNASTMMICAKSMTPLTKKNDKGKALSLPEKAEL